MRHDFKNTGYAALLFIVLSGISSCTSGSSGSGVMPITPDTTSLDISSVNPENNSVTVALNASVSVTFSEAIDQNTIASPATNFLVSGPSGTVIGTVLYDATTKTATFTPTAGFTRSTLYTATISTGGKDQAGNSIASNHSWNFSTSWTVQHGTTGYENGNGLGIDADGNIYVAGSTHGDLDGNVNAGLIDAFVTKYNSAGTLQWTRQIGSTQNDIVTSLAIDQSGNSYVTGYTNGTVFDGHTSAGERDVFLIKYDSAGTVLWSRLTGTTGDDYGGGVAVDNTGNVFICGSISGGIDGQAFANQYLPGFRDIFLTKYDSAGTKQWTRLTGTIWDEVAQSCAVDSVGNVYILGITFEPQDPKILLPGYPNIMVIKYNNAGTWQWTVKEVNLNNDDASGIAVDGTGNVYVVGHTYSDLSTDPTNTNAGQSDAVIIKYDSDGTKQWARLLGSSALDYGYGIKVTSAGAVYVTGMTEGALDGNASAGGRDIYIAKYNTDGLQQWVKQLGTGQEDGGQAIALDANENVYISGYTYGNLDGNLNAGSGTDDYFIIKYKSDVIKQ